MVDTPNPNAGTDDRVNATGNDNEEDNTNNDDDNTNNNNNDDAPPGNTGDAPPPDTNNNRTQTTNSIDANDLFETIALARTTNDIAAIVQAINTISISALPINQDTLPPSVEEYRSLSEEERNRMDKPNLLAILVQQARLSGVTLPSNVNNENKTQIRTRIDDSIRQHALTEILSTSPTPTSGTTTNTQNMQLQQQQPTTQTHRVKTIEEKLNDIGTNMFKWATEKLIINKNSEFPRFEPWSVRFIAYLRAAGGHNIANALESDSSVTSTITTHENRFLHSLLTVTTMGVPHNICKKHRKTHNGLAAWRAMVENFIGDRDATADDFRLELHQLKVRDYEDIVPKIERLDMIHERLLELGEEWHKQPKQVISAYKALVNEAPTYQPIISAFAGSHRTERTPQNLRQELIRFSTAQRKSPAAKLIGKINSHNKTPSSSDNQKKTLPPILGECAKCGHPVRNAIRHKLDGSNCTTKAGNDRWTLQEKGLWKSSYKSDITKPTLIGIIHPIARVNSNSTSSNGFIIDTGSPYHFAQRHLIDDGSFVSSRMTFRGADGTEFTSDGYGEVTLNVTDTNNIPRTLRLKGVRVGTSNIIGNVLERDSPYEFRTKDSILSFHDINTEYAIPLDYNGHYTLSTSTPAYLAISSGDNLLHRRLAHTFHQSDEKCHACMQTRSFYKRGTHGKQKDFNKWLEASPGSRFAFDIKYLPPESPTPYVLRFLDPVSGYIYDRFLDTRNSDEICDNVLAFITERRREGFSVNFLHADQEFNTTNFRNLCDEHMIIYTFAASGQSTQNAHVERSFRTTFTAFRASMTDMKINPQYMTYIWQAIVYLHNRVPRKSAKDNRSPIEILYRVPPPDLSKLRVLGCRAFIGIPPGARTSKNQLIRKIAGTFVGYDDTSRGYLVIPYTSSTPISTTNVEFDETSLATPTPPPPSTIAAPRTKPRPYSKHDDSRPIKIYDVTRDTKNQPDTLFDVDNTDLDSIIFKISTDTKMPFNYGQAMRQDRQRFFPPFEKEVLSNMDLNTFKIIRKDEVAKLSIDPSHILNTRALFREKHNSSGEFVKDKTRILIDGRFAIPGIHFDEVYSPVSTHTTFMSFIATAQRLHRSIWQADVDNAYCNARHDPRFPVYLRPVSGWNDVIDANEHKRPELKKLRIFDGDLLLLYKALYGLGSSGRDWNTDFTNRLLDFGLTQSYSDPCLFYNDMISVIIYVDDILVSAETHDQYQQFLDYLGRSLTIKDLGLAKNVLGVVLHQNIVNGKLQDISIEQGAFIDNIKPLSTVSPTPTSFRSAIGSLSWITRTRPEATFMVNMLAQHQNAPTNKHAKLANRLIQYLKRTNITHLKHDQHFADLVDDNTLHCFVDAAYADDSSRRSRTSFLIFYGTRLIQWQSKLTSIIALSSTEAEYIAITEMDKAVRHITTIFNDLGIEFSATRYYCDAQSAIKLVQRHASTQNTKHIDVRYHYIRDRYQRGAFDLHKIHTSDNPADLLTKLLPRSVRQHHYDVIRGKRWPAVALKANHYA